MREANCGILLDSVVSNIYNLKWKKMQYKLESGVVSIDHNRCQITRKQPIKCG
jgi:hypothetical protein